MGMPGFNASQVRPTAFLALRARVPLVAEPARWSSPGSSGSSRGESELRSLSEQAANLAQCPVDVLDEPEGIRRERDVEARIGEHRKVFDVRFNEPDLDLLRLRKGPRMGELRR